MSPNGPGNRLLARPAIMQSQAAHARAAILSQDARLLTPIQREPSSGSDQGFRSEVRRLRAAADGLDDFRSEERKREKLADIAVGDAFAARNVGERCSLSGSEFLEPSH